MLGANKKKSAILPDNSTPISHLLLASFKAQLGRLMPPLFINYSISARHLPHSLEECALGMLVPGGLAIAADVSLMGIDLFQHADDFGSLTEGGRRETHPHQLCGNRCPTLMVAYVIVDPYCIYVLDNYGLLLDLALLH